MMDHIGLGAGLAALAFWGFVAAVSVAGIWDGVRKREAQHETLRRLAESGQPIDKEVMDKLLMLNSGRYKRYDVDFKVTALWILPVAVGLAVMALVLGMHVPDAKMPILGASALLACLGLGFLLASSIAKRWNTGDDDSDRDQLMG